MKKSRFRNFFIGTFFVVILFGSSAIANSVGNIDPGNDGLHNAAFLDSSVVTDTAINFGKFTTESQYNITVYDNQLRGYAWGSSVGYMVLNCADTSGGCSTNDGSFKVANDGEGLLSGYAWGENTGWINFGPFTDQAISTVKIDTVTGNFEGTQGTAGYAWSQNYGWIVFDCSSHSTCVNTEWRPVSNPVSGGGGGGGGGGGAGGTGGTGSPSGPSTPPPAGGTTTPPDNNGNPNNSDNSNSNNSNNTSDNNTSNDNSNSSSDDTGIPSQPTEPPDNTPPPDQTPPIGTTTQPSNNPDQSNDNQSNNTPSNPLGAAASAIGDAVATAGQAVSNIINSITNALANNGIAGTIGIAGQAVAPLVNGIGAAVRTSTGSTVTKAIAAVGVVTTAAAGSAVLVLANPFSASEILLLPFRLWSLFLLAFGLKKRHRPWGTVYDSVTKQPIDPAYVVLMDMQGNEVATSITDIDGRYGFSVAPGTYVIVANKTNYEFPSKKLADKSSDELYSGLYHGEPITIKEEGEIIAKDIPLDQLNFDWNEFAKNEQQRLTYYHHSDIIIARISSIFFYTGFLVATVALLASHSLYNGVIFGIYILMFIVRRYSPQLKSKGSVTELFTDMPLPFAILHVISTVTGQEITHKVADRLGNYYCLVPNGTYNVAIDRKNADESYTKIPVPDAVVIKDGYLKQSFKI